MADLYGMANFFEGFTAKPDNIIDDMPSTCVAHFSYDVQKESSWATKWDINKGT